MPVGLVSIHQHSPPLLSNAVASARDAFKLACPPAVAAAATGSVPGDNPHALRALLGALPHVLEHVLESRATLVMLPRPLVAQWRQEIARFAPHLTVYEYTGAAKPGSEAEVLQLLRMVLVDVVLVAYHTVKSEYHFRGAAPQRTRNRDARLPLVSALRRLRFWCVLGRGCPRGGGLFWLTSLLALCGLGASCWTKPKKCNCKQASPKSQQWRAKKSPLSTGGASQARPSVPVACTTLAGCCTFCSTRSGTRPLGGAFVLQTFLPALCWWRRCLRWCVRGVPPGV